jgi:hypothetical protein
VLTEKLNIVITGNADGATRAFGKTREGVKSISEHHPAERPGAD